jgi:serine/threonine-protein kinase
MQERAFSADRAIDVLLQICAALEAAHASGVIHRDLKPANVMMETTETGDERVRVLDFGMSKVLKGDAGATALTEANMVFGTPEYMSPEQARGEDLDATCDIYAAGAILYELLTGTVPLSGSNAIATMTAHLVEPVEPPSARAPDKAISKALEAVILCALAKRPRDRYPSARAFADALEHAAVHPDDTLSVRPSGQPSKAPPSSRPSRGLHRARPEEAAILSPIGWAMVAVVAAGVGIGIGVWISLRP